MGFWLLRVVEDNGGDGNGAAGGLVEALLVPEALRFAGAGVVGRVRAEYLPGEAVGVDQFGVLDGSGAVDEDEEEGGVESPREPRLVGWARS